MPDADHNKKIDKNVITRSDEPVKNGGIAKVVEAKIINHRY